MAKIDLTNGAAPATPAAGKVSIYTKTDKKIYIKDDAGLETPLIDAGLASITALTGDVTATGPGSVAATLATVNANVGSFTNASVTVNAKGLITAASSGTAPVTSVGVTAPLASTGGVTPTLSIPAATTSVSGHLTSTDWNTFNGKQNALGFTPEDVANKATSLAVLNNTLYPTTQAIGTALGSYVPYTGATGSLDMGAFDVSATNGTLLGTLALGATDNAVIIGDVSGDPRGDGAVDISRNRSDVQYVASGDYSTLVGYDNIASGFRSIAIGYINEATLNRSTAIGCENVVTASRGVAVGRGNTVSGSFSLCFGDETTVIGSSSMSFGAANTVDGDSAAAFGEAHTVSGFESQAVGYNHSVSGAGSLAIGLRQFVPFANFTKFGASDSSYISLNATGMSVSNDNPVEKIHSTGNVLASNVTSVGSELVTNGTFAGGSSTGWTFGTGWTVSPTAATKNAAGTGTLSQALAITSGKYYYITFDIVSLNIGALTVSLGGVSLPVLYSDTSASTRYVRAVIKASSTASLVFTPSSSDTNIVGIDNISVKEITGGDVIAVGGLKGSTLQLKTGATVTNILTATATLDFPSIASNSYSDLTITVTGAVTGASVHLGAPSGFEANLTFCGWVSAADTVKVRIHNGSGGAINPASATWRATVFNY